MIKQGKASRSFKGMPAFGFLIKIMKVGDKNDKFEFYRKYESGLGEV
jgi:hypothetical protein